MFTTISAIGEELFPKLSKKLNSSLFIFLGFTGRRTSDGQEDLVEIQCKSCGRILVVTLTDYMLGKIECPCINSLRLIDHSISVAESRAKLRAAVLANSPRLAVVTTVEQATETGATEATSEDANAEASGETIVTTYEGTTNVGGMVHVVTTSRRRGRYRTRKVCKKTLDGQVIEAFDSIVAAADSLIKEEAEYKLRRNSLTVGIGTCCRGRKDSYKGYKWEYCD